MSIYYVDTSALVKKYRTERGTDVVAELFGDRVGTDVLLTSYLTVLEFTSVATRVLRGRGITRRAYQVMMGSLSKDLVDVIQLQSVTDNVVSDAIKLSLDHALRAADAVHLATALGIRNVFPGEPCYFVASDAKLNAVSDEIGLVVLDPEKTGALGILRSYRRGE